MVSPCWRFQCRKFWSQVLPEALQLKLTCAWLAASRLLLCSPASCQALPSNDGCVSAGLCGHDQAAQGDGRRHHPLLLLCQPRACRPARPGACGPPHRCISQAAVQSSTLHMCSSSEGLFCGYAPAQQQRGGRQEHPVKASPQMLLSFAASACRLQLQGAAGVDGARLAQCCLRVSLQSAAESSTACVLHPSGELSAAQTSCWALRRSQAGRSWRRWRTPRAARQARSRSRQAWASTCSARTCWWSCWPTLPR